MTKSALLTLALFAFIHGDARADDDPREPTWSLGAGVGATVMENGVTQLAPIGALIFERRLSRHLWLTANPFFLGDTSDEPLTYIVANGGSQSRATDAFYAVGGMLGVRYLLNPGGIVEVSPTVAITAGYSHNTLRYSENSTPMLTATDEDANLGVVVGVAVERQLLPNLYLRLATTLLGANASWGNDSNINVSPPTSESVPISTRQHTQRIQGGVSLSPSLSLRLAI